LINSEVADDRDEEDKSPTGITGKKDSSADAGGDPTYEMACVRRYITGAESISQFIENSRKMFLLQVKLIKFFLLWFNIYLP
jgi:hypothetical protein